MSQFEIVAVRSMVRAGGVVLAPGARWRTAGCELLGAFRAVVPILLLAGLALVAAPADARLREATSARELDGREQSSERARALDPGMTTPGSPAVVQEPNDVDARSADAEWNLLDEHRRRPLEPLGLEHIPFWSRFSDEAGQQEGAAIAVEPGPGLQRRWLLYGVFAVVALSLVAAVRGASRVKRARESRRQEELELEVRRRTQKVESRLLALEEANRRLLEVSLTDPLTGLHNRRFLSEMMAQEAALILRRSSARTSTGLWPSLALILVDLDHLKLVNDQLGHLVGDQMLLRTRDVLNAISRTGDVVIRWGGDEFLLVAHDCSAARAEALAERIRSTLEQCTILLPNGRCVQVTCSVGFACYPLIHARPGLFSWEDSLALADDALLRAKSAGAAWVGLVTTSGSSPDMLQEFLHTDRARLIRKGQLRVATSGRPRSDA